MKCWQAVGVVIEDAVEGAIHSIIDIVHQCSVSGPFIFLCEGERIFLLVKKKKKKKAFSIVAFCFVFLFFLRPSKLPSESSSMMTFLAMMLTTSV